jgi:hypothetical protein
VGSDRAWHGTHDLSSAFLTAIGYVIDLATRNKDADFHERFALLMDRLPLQASVGSKLRTAARGLTLRPTSECVLWISMAQMWTKLEDRERLERVNVQGSV